MKYQVAEDCQIPGLAALLDEHIGFKRDGHFVEVGAEDGLHCSNTWTLAELGWKGIVLKPRPEDFQALLRNHARHEDLILLPLAAADYNGIGRLYLDGPSGSCSTLREDLIPAFKEIGAGLDPNHFTQVEVATLDWVLDFYGWRPGFDLLSVDAVGAERQVLGGFDLARWRPRMMIWELKELHPTEGLRQEGQELAARIGAKGYRAVAADMLNTVFVRET